MSQLLLAEMNLPSVGAKMAAPDDFGGDCRPNQNIEKRGVKVSSILGVLAAPCDNFPLKEGYFLKKSGCGSCVCVQQRPRVCLRCNWRHRLPDSAASGAATAAATCASGWKNSCEVRPRVRLAEKGGGDRPKMGLGKMSLEPLGLVQTREPVAFGLF